GIIGLLALLAAALIAVAWFTLRPTVEAPTVQPLPVAAREQFHATKPLRLQVQASTVAEADEERQRGPIHGRRHERNHLLNRGRMRVVAEQPADIAARGTFTLRVTLSDAQAELELLAPDERSERQATLALPGASRLETLQAFA